jgi:hypothetical protein
MTSEWLIFRMVMGTVSAVACFIFSTFLFLHGTDRRVSWSFAFSILFLGLWNISEPIIYITPPHLIIFVDRLSYFWATLLGYFFFQFVSNVLGGQLFGRVIVFFHRIFTVILLVLSLSPYLIRDVITRPNFMEIPGPMYFLFVFYLIGLLLVALFKLHSSWRKAEGFRRNQLKYIELGVLVGTFAGSLYFLAIYIPSIPPFFHVIELAYVSLIPITILRARMMDINMAFRYSVVHLVFGFALGLPLAGLMWLLSGNPLVAAISLILPTFGYMIIKRWSVKVLDLVDQLSPFRGRYSALRVLEHHERQVAQGGSLNEWAKRLVRAARDIFSPESCFVLVRDEGDGSFLVMASEGISSDKKAFLSIPIEGPLADQARSGEILLKEMIERDPASEPSGLRAELSFLGATAIVPISFGNQVYALLCLGPKIGRDMYNEIDLAGLHGLAKSAQLALNALLSGSQSTRMGAAWAHDLLSPLGPKGTFHVIEDVLSGVHGPLTPTGRMALSNLKNDLEFVRTGLKTVVTSVSPRSQKPVAIPVRAIYERLRDRYARAAKESRISWIVSLPPETVRIIADEPAIERRVLGNLVENALRHTPSGGTVEVGYRIEDKTFVGFVRDTGPGISKENLPKLFCPGTQLDPNTKGLAGLGLASVKAVIESHHGRVWVESEPGRATTFYFVLPVQDII